MITLLSGSKMFHANNNMNKTFDWMHHSFQFNQIDRVSKTLFLITTQ